MYVFVLCLVPVLFITSPCPPSVPATPASVAGGLATYLHADYVNSVLSPQTAPLKAIADAG